MESCRPRPALLAGHPEDPSPTASSVSEATRRRLATSSIARGSPPPLPQMLLANPRPPGPPSTLTPPLPPRARPSRGAPPPHTSRLDLKRDAARPQQPQTRGPPGQLVASTTCRFQHVLAVVDHQQRPAARHRIDNTVESRCRPGPPDPYPFDQGSNHLIIGPTRHQVDIARQLSPARPHLDPRRLNPQSGLSHPPNPHQRHPPMASQPGANLPHLSAS